MNDKPTHKTGEYDRTWRKRDLIKREEVLLETSKPIKVEPVLVTMDEHGKRSDQK